MSYAIRCTPHYYANDIHGNDKEYLVTGSPPFDDTITLALHTKAEADTLACIMNCYSSQGYYLNQNQYAQPEYAVVPYKGKASPRDLSSAMWALGYGVAADGEFLSGLSLRNHFDSIIKDSVS